MPENAIIPDGEAALETAKEKFERERLSRRQALKKYRDHVGDGDVRAVQRGRSVAYGGQGHAVEGWGQQGRGTDRN